MRFFRNVWHDIRSGQNLDAYITISIALIVAVLGVAGVASQNVVFSAILAVLALVATGLLVNRQADKDLRNAISRIENLDHLADKFFGREYNRYELQKLLRSSRKVFFWGINLARTIPLIKDDITYGLENGLEIRFLLIEPLSEAVKMAEFRSRDSTIDEINSTLESNLSILLNLSKKTSSGKLEIRCINYLPYCTAVGFDPHLRNGQIFVRLLTFKMHNEARPNFVLTSQDDNYWFSFFAEQFESVWNEAQPVSNVGTATTPRTSH